MFAYCGNNPVNRFDPTGEEWLHWVVGAAVVVGFGLLTVVTCGGSLAAAATAVSLVSYGVAASTTATTVAAAAFIGSATVYGAAAWSAYSNSNSAEEFAAQGNWGTVFATALGGAISGNEGYRMSQIQRVTTNTYKSRGSTGRTNPQNLKEKLAMEQVQADPLNGATHIPVNMNDPRWPGAEGWEKMSSNVNGVEIHYVHNKVLGIFDDFKFKG